MAIPRVSLALALALLAAGCGTTARAPHPDAMNAEARRLERRSADCDSSATEDCTRVLFTYVEVTAAPTPGARQAINAWITDYLLAPWEEGVGTETQLDTLAARFIAAYESFVAENGADTPEWSLVRTVKTIPGPPGVFSLIATDETYTGGAHPNATTRLVSFEDSTGRALQLADLLVAGYEASFAGLGEKAFRMARQIPEGQSIQNAGFWFAGDSLRLNGNFAATDKGLRFFYNAGEAGPYALGPTDLLIPYADLGPLLRPDGPLITVVRAARPA